ncbi:hypothetical protein M9H77_08188 [Catharanthus roseus]|uniref:Uncharacterized protein n=1 Tax=Catharanthus roseus TaxID=4058 RepID=A0ACC0BXD6_CATRO|nr:hypothetical protein M9H77_08188 [Catharanthus roseus]
MEKTQLIFIPWPTMGHLAQLVELAKLIISKKNQFSITVLIMKLPDFIDADGGVIIDSFVSSSNTEGLQFLYLPPTESEPEWSSRTRGYFTNKLVESQKSNVKDLIRKNSSKKINGFVVDMLCTSMIDVAADFGVPSYVFFTSGAGFLNLMLHFQTLQDDQNQDISELLNSNPLLTVPGFANPIPSAVLPLVLSEKQSWLGRFLHYARGYRKAKGIIINSFLDLEKDIFNSITISETTHQRIPRTYPIGPILNQVKHVSSDGNSEIMKWLAEQPPKSVVYVCFGSQGSLDEDQVKELASGLEQSGYRFLCSLRRTSPDNTRAVFPSEFENQKEVLPEGFLDRTASIGKIVGWVPQLAVLSEPAIGGFISHCGWNSILESIWSGVPIATWPLHSEQQLNAFQLVKELGLAVEISLDYQERSVEKKLVTAEEIERGIRNVMHKDSEVRKNVKEMKEKSRMSIIEDGSSYKTLEDLIDNLLLKIC